MVARTVDPFLLPHSPLRQREYSKGKLCRAKSSALDRSVSSLCVLPLSRIFYRREPGGESGEGGWMQVFDDDSVRAGARCRQGSF
jgi:hypothetical protein